MKTAVEIAEDMCSCEVFFYCRKPTVCCYMHVIARLMILKGEYYG